MKEYKIAEIKKEKTCENIEALMNRMAEEGWEVVSTTYDAWSKVHPQLLVTFSREKE